MITPDLILEVDHYLDDGDCLLVVQVHPEVFAVHVYAYTERGQELTRTVFFTTRDEAVAYAHKG